MKRYTFKHDNPTYMEQLEEQVKNEKTKEIISILTDENFGNENQRKKFVDLITSLFNIADSDARRFIRELGKACTNIGNDMLASEEVEEVDEEYEEEDFAPYEFRRGGEVVFESIILSPLAYEDDQRIRSFLTDQSIKYRDIREDHIPAIEILMEKDSYEGKEVLTELYEIARFDEV